MARNTRADRQFLANTPGLTFLTFTKPLDQLSPSYLHRLAQSVRRQADVLGLIEQATNEYGANDTDHLETEGE